jgi:two-component system response regulator HydG
MRILIVDDEHIALSSLRRLLRRRGYREVDVCAEGKQALEAIRNNSYDLVLLDLLMPEVDGMQVLESTRAYVPQTEFIILTAVDDIQTAIKAVRLGAFDYLVKPVDNQRLFLSIERAFERRGLRACSGNEREPGRSAQSPPEFRDIITRNPHMNDILTYAGIIARSSNPVLITGESGTGKELLARGIHRASRNRSGQLVTVNISSIPDSLFESQIFGHIKGSFTGAVHDHPGFFEQAHGGTLFLDEIGELPMHLQPKLLRVIEDQTLTRLGDTVARRVNVRIVSATNRNLDEACREKNFRLDFMYRLKSAHIHLPPLHERREDVSLLAGHFLRTACVTYDKKIEGFSPEAMELLEQKEYPGNIRELKQLVDNAALFCDSGTVMPVHLGLSPAPASGLSRSLCTLKEDAQRHMLFVLSRTGGDRKEAARILGISLRQIQRRIAQMSRQPRWKDLLGDISVVTARRK